MVKNPHPTKIEEFAERLTQGIGSAASIVIHTVIFAACFVLGFLGVNWEKILLILTTAVSLEAIYLAILIQMTVNRNTQSLEEVEEDIDEIQEDIAEVEKDIDEMQEDIGEIQEDEKEQDLAEQKLQGAIQHFESTLVKLLEDIERLKNLQK